MRTTKRVMLAALTLAMLALLFVRSQVLDAADHNRALDAARHLRELDGQLDVAVLEAQSGATLDDDTVSSMLRDMSAIQRLIESAAVVTDDTTLAPYVAGTHSRIAERQRLLASLKAPGIAVTSTRAHLPTTTPPLDRSVRGVLVVTQENPYESLYLALRDRRDAEIERANGYRVGLVGMSVALLIAIGAMFLRLHRNAAALAEALTCLEQEKRVVEEKQREVSALNHSLEARVEERTSELSASREEYRSLLETTQAIPWSMAPGSLRLAYVGPQAVRILGHSVADCMSGDFLRRNVHVDDRKQALAALTGLSSDGAHGEIELRVLDAMGREVWLRGVVNTTVDTAGRPVRRGIFVDVTSRRRLEAELRAAQKLESLGRLSAGVAHEINTPVQFVSDSVHYIETAFASLASLLATYRGAVREDIASDAERASLAEAAREADVAADTDYALENVPLAIESSIDGLDRIATIVKSLKTFAHPDRKEKSPVDLNANIKSTLTLATNEYKHVADLQTVFGELPLVLCHGGEISQVVLNLVVNAAHAIAEGAAASGKKGRIIVRTWQEGATACVCVRDTGTGIPSAIRDKIFDPFFTTKEVGLGSGQGLALARKIVVDMHGGELTFETEEGRGTAFVIRLPIGAVTAVAA